jgi:RHS repeat-associated protein
MRWSKSISVILALFWASVCFAQVGPTPPPREDSVSPVGVSYHSGSFSYETSDLSIGSDASKSLTLKRSYLSSLDPVFAISPQIRTQGWTSNLAMRFTNAQLPPAFEGSEPPPGTETYLYSISVGTRSVGFLGGTTYPTGGFPGTYDAAALGGEQLSFTGTQTTGHYTFTDTDGSVTEFNPYSGSSAPLHAASTTAPDGTTLTYVYDADGLRSISSNRGYALLFEYGVVTGSTRAATKACAVNLAETYVTSTSACPVGAQAVTYGYTTSGTAVWPLLSSVTDALGGVTTYLYAGRDHLSCVKLPSQSSCQVTNTYGVCTRNPDLPSDPYNLRWFDKVTSQVTGTGETYAYAYPSLSFCPPPHDSGNTTMTVAGSATTTVGTTAGGQTYSLTNPLGRVTSLAYAGKANEMNEETLLADLTNPETNRMTFVYDTRGNATEQRIKAKSGTGLFDLVTTASYPTTCTNAKTCNKPDYIIDPKGNRTDYTYDATHGGILTETRPAAPNGIRPQKRYSYTQLYAWIKNSGGSYVQAASPVWLLTGTSECRTLASCVGTADETRTTITYGTTGTANNLLPTVETISSGDSALAATTIKTYDAQGNVLTIDGPLPGTADTTRMRYYVLRRMIGVVGPDPDGAGSLSNRATRNTYDPAGRLIKVERGTVASQSDADWSGFVALEATDTVYDVMGRKLKDTVSGGGVAIAVTQYSYDNFGRPQCTAVRMDPAQWGSQTDACTPQTTGPNGPDRITKLTYDAAGQRLKLQMAVGTADAADEETSTYTNNGKQASVADGLGNLTTYIYDGHDRLSQTRYPVASNGAVSSTTDYEGLTYDANSNVVQRRLRDGQTISSSYDALNRVTLKDLPAPEVDVSYGYDLQGRVLAATQGSSSIGQVYDALGRMTGETTSLGTMSWQYDLAGRQIRTTWPDAFYATQDYLVTGEVTAVRENGAGSGIGVLGIFAYDNLGRRTSLTRGNGSVTSYGYDAVSRLAILGHDVVGTSNDVTTSFTYNPANQIAGSTRSNDSYAWGGHYNVDRPYTVNGLNQLTGAGSTTLSYDGRGNLTSSGASSYAYTSENRLVSGPNGAALQYDPSGRLSQSSSASSAVTRFQYAGTDLVTEYDASGALLRRYVHGAGTDTPLIWYEGSGTSDRRWYHQDERGSVIGVSNSAATMLAINAYDEYGIPAATNLGRFGYTGQTWLPEVGLNYFKARLYSPTLGRFMQTDPIGYGDGINWYAYVNGDPVNNRDVIGTETRPNEVPGRRIVVIPQRRAEHIREQHSPDPYHNGGKDQFRRNYSDDQLRNKAGFVVSEAIDSGTTIREGDRTVYEARTGSALTNILFGAEGSQGQTTVRVVGTDLANIADPKMRKEALAEVAKVSPEAARNVSVDRQGSTPVQVIVVMTMYPVVDDERKTSPK